MGSLKKNLTLTVVLVVCVLVFCAGAYLAFAESSQIAQAKQKITSAETQLNSMRFADPAPTEANVKASQQNVDKLEAELRNIRDDLQQGARLTTSTDGIGVMAGINQYITEYQRKAAALTDEAGAPDPIELPNDFAFGFEQYLTEAPMINDRELVSVLDKQRQILSYLLNKLYASDPASIVEVKREVLELKAKSDGKSGFQINKAISARVPGAIDTLGFSITFTGYTDSLRSFLNNLAKFDLPIVVRSIEVKRPSGQATTVASGSKNNLDDIFGVFGGGDSSATETPAEAQKPIIAENLSTFTVILEFIEIVLPTDSVEDNV